MRKTTRQPSVDRLDIDHGELPSWPRSAQPVGAYVRIGSTGKLVPILSPGDDGYEENNRIVSVALGRST